MTTDTTTKKKGIHFAWFVLVGVVLMMGLCRGGISSGQGLFFQPISVDLHVGIGEVALMVSISSLVTTIWSPFAGRLLDKFDIRILTVIGVIIMGCSYGAMSLIRHLWQFYILGGLMSLGSVFTIQLVGPVMINRWFKEKNGLAMGIMMSSVAIFSAILSPIVALVISLWGWRVGYVVVGMTVLVVVTIAVLLLFRTPEQKHTLPLGVTEYDREETQVLEEETPAPAQNLPGITYKQALKTPTFWFYFVFMLLLCGVLVFTTVVPAMAIEAGFDTVTSGFAMTAFMVGSALAAIAVGVISDKLGPLKAALLACSCGIIAMLGLLFFRSNLYVLFGSLFLFGCTSPALSTVGPLILGTLFGQKEFGSIYGAVIMATGIGAMILTPVYGFIYDIAGSFSPALILILCFMAICVATLILAFKTGKKVQMTWMSQRDTDV